MKGRPLRIALIASCRYPIRQPFAGGLEAHVWHLARSLAEAGHEVSLFAGPGSDPDLGTTTMPVHTVALSAVAQADPSMPSADFLREHHAYLALMLTLSKQGAQDFDIVHNHSLHYLPVAMAPALTTPMLTTLHTPPTPWLESAIAIAGHTAHRFAAVSAHTAAAWVHATAPLPVIHNGIDTRQWPLGPGGHQLVWFGRITVEKAPHLAIDAARRAGRPLTLAGPISDSRYFADQIRPALGTDVHYAGHLTQDRLAELVGRAAVALVTPAWDEPYGLVVAEAMCCGTPVVAMARGGIPELVTVQSGRLVRRTDASALAEAIAEAVRLDRRQVRAHAVRHCSSRSMVRAYLQLYRTMIADKNSRTHDRLLHPPSRFRASGPGHKHQQPYPSAGGSIDLTADPRTTSVRGSDHAGT
jgi:glycosyltransferase involved in cell wall biosynthesis